MEETSQSGMPLETEEFAVSAAPRDNSPSAPSASLSATSAFRLDSPSPASRLSALRLIVVLGALSTFGPLSIDMYLPALPSLARDFGATDSQTQLTLSACLIGLALGQVIVGPISDTRGRRVPLLLGVAAYGVASALCVVAPSIYALMSLRFVQGLAGAAGIVIARAIVRDLHSGVAAARFYSILMIVSGLAPILAPVFGGQLLRFTSWRGVFVTLAIISVVLVLAAATTLGETHPRERRQMGGIRATLATFRHLLADRAFLGYALGCGLAFAAMFAYISGSPFVLQGAYGVTPQVFSLIFGANAFGLMIIGQINGRLVGRIAPRRLLAFGLSAQALGGLALLATIALGVGIRGVVPALFVVVASLGFVLPNATALALTNHPRAAGSASALVGVLQFATGSLVAPITGIALAPALLPAGVTLPTGQQLAILLSALPMALVIGALPLLAIAVFVAGTRAEA
ncbi:MAG TPA: Bcr/CflA family multidrug efflux MFS transporter [Ktedonobacterales bacterium]